jgi:thioredoxin-related protein
MKKTALFALCLLFVGLVQAQEINFNHGTWAEIKAKAKAGKKIIFVDAYTTWCGPCKAMARNTFTKTSVANYYNSNFINAKIDMEKGEGIEIAKKYEVSCYPNLLYIDGEGNLVHRGAGYLDTTDFLAMGKAALSPDKNFAAMKKQYESGTASGAFVAEYIQKLAMSCLSANDAATTYLKTVKESDLILPANWRILHDYIEDINSPAFTYMVKNRAAFVAKYTSDSVNGKIFNCYLNEGLDKVRDKKANPEALASIKADIKKTEFERSDELGLMIDLSYYKVRTDWENYFKSAKVLVEKYKQKDANFINSVSWTIYEKSKNKTHLTEAESWAKHMLEFAPVAGFMDTYACLLYKNGKRTEAIAAEKKAIEKAIENKEETKDLEETLKGFEAGKP